MKILLNGIPEEFTGDGLTVRQILDRKGWSFPLIIARVDGKLVERRAWESAPSGTEPRWTCTTCSAAAERAATEIHHFRFCRASFAAFFTESGYLR